MPANKICCYIEIMSRHSAKTAGRSTKTARRTAKKSTKSVRSAEKKASKSARSPVGKINRTTRVQGAATKMIRTQSPPVQPVAAHEIPIRTHKYQVGEICLLHLADVWSSGGDRQLYGGETVAIGG